MFLPLHDENLSIIAAKKTIPKIEYLRTHMAVFYFSDVNTSNDENKLRRFSEARRDFRSAAEDEQRNLFVINFWESNSNRFAYRSLNTLVGFLW